MNEIPPEILAVCEQNGYLAPRLINGKICAIVRMAYTVGLVVGIGKQTYEYRYCYQYASDAMEDMNRWTGVGHPIGPWIKRKGGGFDDLNPRFGDRKF